MNKIKHRHVPTTVASTGGAAKAIRVFSGGGGERLGGGRTGKRRSFLPLGLFCLAVTLSLQAALLFRVERRYDPPRDSAVGNSPPLPSSEAAGSVRGVGSDPFAMADVNRFLKPDGSVGEYIMYSNDQAYFKECRTHMLTNDTWGEERAPLVDKVLSKKLTMMMEVPNLRIIPTYKVFNASNLDAEFNLELLRSLPQPYMIKSSHLSGGIARVCNGTYQHIKPGRIRRPRPLDERAFQIAKKQVVKDMKLDFTVVAGEPQYKFLKPAIIIEKDILTGSDIDNDVHNWYVAGGKVIFVSYQCADPPEGKLASYSAPRIWVSSRFQKINMKLGKEVCEGDFAKPANWETQRQIAEDLAGHMPHPGVVRIDLYAGPTEIYFSEFTFSSAACQYNFAPRVADGLLYAVGNGQIPRGAVTASFVEGVIEDRSWAMASLYDGGLLDARGSGAYPSPVDLCKNLTSGEQKRRQRLTKKGKDMFGACIGAAREVSSEPFRCVVSEGGGETVTSFGAPLRPTVASIMDQLNPWRVMVLLVGACALTHFGVGTKVESQYRNNCLYLLGLGLAVYVTTPGIAGLYSGRSPLLVARESFVAFRNVHPMESPLVALSHFGTYWLQLAAWRSKSVRNMLVWRLLSESVTGAVNEYSHHLEQQSDVRCMRLAFIGAMHNYAYDNIIREFLVPPFFVYLWLLPNFVCHWSLVFLRWLCFWC